jgi:hypothetical protein
MTMERREFVLLVFATWAWPTVVLGQQQSMPVLKIKNPDPNERIFERDKPLIMAPMACSRMPK